MRVIPLTPSILYVSVPIYGGSNPPIVNAWAVTADEPADCSTFDAAHPGLFQLVPEHTVDVPTSYLEAHHYDTAYTQAVVNAYDVPEGSTIVVCARWYDVTAPVWDRNVPTKQQFVVASSPDAWVPLVSVRAVHLSEPVVALSATITGSTQTGYLCGAATFPPADTSPRPRSNSVARCATRGPATLWSSSSVGTGGNIVLSSDVDFQGTDVHSSSVLPLSRFACYGDCEAPPPLDYVIDLPKVTVGAGVCGSFLWFDCTPPTRETSLGTAEIHVSWGPGHQNHLEHWVIGAPDTTVPDAPPPPDNPIFDTERAVDVTLSDDGTVGTASMLIRSDRHVTYTASIAGDCFVGDIPPAATGETHPSAPGDGGAPTSP